MADRAPERNSDAELVAAAAGGSKEAFGVLAWRHRPLAVRVCCRFLGDPDLAADVVQEAIVVALVQLGRLVDPERFGSWLCGIALNLARQRLRHRQRWVLVPWDGSGGVPSRPEPEPVPPPDHEGDPADAVLRSELAERVRRAVAELAPGQREAVLHFYFLGRTHREVAAELDISVNAVKARLHQARAALEPRLVAATADDHRPPTDRRDRPDRPDRIADEEAPMVSNPAVEMRVHEVRRAPDDGTRARRHVIVLRERDGERHLPIWCGQPEATALALDLQGVEMPRPMTHQFAANLVAASGARLHEVRVTRLEEGTFYAVVVLDAGPEDGGDRPEVDARPSDALNLAVLAGVPIRVDAAVLEECAGRRHHQEWLDYEDTTAAIATEVRDLREQERQRLLDELDR